YPVTVVDADHFTIGVDTTTYVPYLSGGTALGNVFTLATPYAWPDLPKLKFVQSADTMTIVHPSYAPRKLTRSGHANWQLSQITFAPATPAPTGLIGSVPGSQNFVVTAISDSNGEESLPSNSYGTGSTTETLTWTSVQGCTNYNVYKQK